MSWSRGGDDESGVGMVVVTTTQHAMRRGVCVRCVCGVRVCVSVCVVSVCVVSVASCIAT